MKIGAESMRFSRAAASGMRNVWRMARRRRGGRPKADEGQALVEFAVTIPVLLFFTFTIIEICLAYYSYCIISEVAREGTRFAMVRGSTCQLPSGASCSATAAQIQTFVSQVGYPNLGGGTMSSTASFPAGNNNPNSPVQITVTYTFPIQLPFVPGNSILMRSTSAMNILQ